MNNTINSTLYSFLVSTALLTGTAGAMEDLSLSVIILPNQTPDGATSVKTIDSSRRSQLPVNMPSSPKTELEILKQTTQNSSNNTITTPFLVKTTLYDEKYTELQNLITQQKDCDTLTKCLSELYDLTEDKSTKKTIVSLTDELKKPSIDRNFLEKNLPSIKPQKTEQPPFKLSDNLVDSWNQETARKYQALEDLKKLETLFECVNNQLNRYKSDRQNHNSKKELIDTLNEIKKLLPHISTIRKGKIETIITQHSDNQQELTDELFDTWKTSISEITLLSLSPDQPDQIVQDSFIEQKRLEKQGILCPNPIETGECANFIVAQNDLSDSLKIYLLQLMWWKEMSGPKNKLKIINSLNAKNISNALRTIASKKDKSCCVTYQTDGYNRNKRPEIKHINDDHYCEGSECYSIATLPSIIHNAGKAPRPYFHDQNVNKFKLEQLIQKEGLSSDFKALLEVLQKISAKPVPEYDNSQPNRRAETTPNPVQKLIDQGKHFPLTQESLENPKLPDNFKLLLEKYLKRNSQTEEEQTISKTEQLIVHLQDRKNYLENYITNISIHPSRYDHLRYKEWNHQGPELTHINKSYNNADLIDINPSNETYKNALLENLIKRLSGIPEKINPEEIISTWHKIVIEEINQEIAQIDIRIAELNKAINNHNEKGDSDIIDALSQAAIFNPGTFTIVEQSVGKDNSYYNSEEDIKASIEATNPNQSRASDTVQEENPNQPGANVRLSVESSSSSSSSDEDNTPEDETTPTSNPTTTPIQTVGTDYTIDTNDKTSIDQSKETSSNEHQEKNTSYFAATWNFISNSTASVWNSLWSILGLFKFW